MLTTPTAKRILIYGDSYVFGKIPGGMRYLSNERYTGQLQQMLGDGYDILEEGLRGRTLSGENGFLPHRDGLVQFDGIFGSHVPLDMVIIALGTNDCNRLGNVSYDHVQSALDSYQTKIKWWCEHLGGYPLPRFTIIIPPVINEDDSLAAFGDWFKGSTARSKELISNLATYAKEAGVSCLDLSSCIQVSHTDGVHLDINNNQLIAKNLAKFIKEQP